MQKYGRRVRVSLLSFCNIQKKRYREKSRYLSWRRRRDSTGFQPVVFALRTVYFMSLFAPQKDGRRVRVSLPFLHYTEKRYRGKSRYLSCEDRTIEMFLRFRCLDLNTRRVCRRYQFYVGILSINSFIVVDLKTIPKPSTSCVAKAVPVGTACN